MVLLQRNGFTEATLRLAAAAQEWLLQSGCSLQPRFDVAEVYAPQGVDTPSPEIRYWENAFSLD